MAVKSSLADDVSVKLSVELAANFQNIAEAFVPGPFTFPSKVHPAADSVGVPSDETMTTSRSPTLTAWPVNAVQVVAAVVPLS
jgi:hypothetical protein